MGDTNINAESGKRAPLRDASTTTPHDHIEDLSGDRLSRELMTDTVNVTFDGEYSALSNLAATSFTLGGERFASVEAFVQALKREPGEKRQRIQQLDGYQAQRAGKNPNKIIRAQLLRAREKSGPMPEVYWQGRSIEYGSEEHQDLIEQAIRMKFEVSSEARDVLVSTGDKTLIHDTGKPQRPTSSLPAEKFCSILMAIRNEITSGTFHTQSETN